MYSRMLEKIVNLQKSLLNMFLKGHFIPQIETNHSKILEKIEFDKLLKKIINSNLLYNFLFYTDN